MNNRPKISAIILTKNEEERIGQCLECLKWVDEIIVVDDNSTDNTLDVCKGYQTVKIYSRKMCNGFGPQKNYALSKANGDWVIAIDADEAVSPALRDEIRRKIDEGNCDGFRLRLVNYILGRWLLDYKAKNLRLFRRGKGSFSNVKVHETVVVDGKVGKLENPLIHRSRNYIDITTTVQTSDKYSKLMAHEKWRKGVGISGMDIPVRLLVLPAWYFFRKFVLHRSFRNGPRGLLLSIFSSIEYFMTYAKLWEMQHVKKEQD
jgi:glycosyltransferase involved in cell wall biosynthesis